MSEDATFRRLKRVPIEDLDAEYRERYLEFYLKPDVFDKWLEENGWFEKEFCDAGSKYESDRKQLILGSYNRLLQHNFGKAV